MAVNKVLPPDYEALGAITAGDCTTLPTEQIEAYDSTEHDMTFRCFRRHFTRGQWNAISEHFRYEINAKAGLTMENDWHVRYGWGYLEGKKVVCLHHSQIHYFFLTLTEQHGAGVYYPTQKVASCQKKLTSKNLNARGTTKTSNMRGSSKPVPMPCL